MFTEEEESLEHILPFFNSFYFKYLFQLIKKNNLSY